MSISTTGAFTETSIKVIKYSGLKKEWIPWHVQHLARATKKGQRGILDGTVALPTKTEIEAFDLTDADDVAKMKIATMHSDAYSDLLLSMQYGTPHGNIAFEIVRKSYSDEYPNGNAAEAFAKLKKKYQPDTGPELARLSKLFYGTKQKRGEDPDLYISYLEDLRNRMTEMKPVMSDEQFITHTLNNLEREYENQVNLLERSVGASTDPMTIERMRDELCLRYERVSGKTEAHGEEETALHMGTQFKGKCYVCGKIGHKGANCRERPQRNQQGGRGNFNRFQGRGGYRGSGGRGGKGARFTGNCNYCKKVGHKAIDCRQRKADENPREEADVCLMAQEGSDLGTCVHCGSKGILWTPCNRCEDTGFVYSVTEYEEDGRGNYWEESEDENSSGSDTNSSNLSHEPHYVGPYIPIPRVPRVNRSENIALISEEVVQVADLSSVLEADGIIPINSPSRASRVDLSVDETSGESPTYSEIENGEHIVLLTINKHTKGYRDSLMNHNSVGCKGLFDLLIIASLEWQKDWDPAGANALAYAQRRYRQLYAFGVSTIELFLKNVTVIQRNLELLDEDQFEYREYLYLVNTAVDYFAVKSGVAIMPNQEEVTESIPGAPGSRQVYPASDDGPDEIALYVSPKVKVKSTGAQNICIGDSGASCHMTCTTEGLFDWKEINSPVKIGDGNSVMAEKVGKKRVTVVQRDGSVTDIVLTNVKYVPKLFTNLFSISTAIKHGWDISNKGQEIRLMKNNVMIAFDYHFKTQNGQIPAIEMIPRHDVATVLLDQGSTVDINLMHAILGHANEDTVKKTALHYNIKLTGEWDKCVHCAVAKARQRNVSKVSETPASKVGERLYMDISSVKTTTFGGNKYWLLVIDEASDMCWSYFLNRKSDLPKTMYELVTNLKTFQQITVKNIVKSIRCDDAGKNKSCKKLFAEKGLPVVFEFTGPGTPQFNGRVERKFATLYGKVRAMLNAANLPKEIREGVWAEAAQYASNIENILVSQRKATPAYQHIHGTKNPTLKGLHPFGELAVVEINKTRKIRKKLDDMGIMCLYLGRALNHSLEIGRFLNLSTKCVILSRDVPWLGKTYGDWKGVQGSKLTPIPVNPDDSDDDECVIVENPGTTAPIVAVDVVPTPEAPANPRVVREMQRLAGWFNPGANGI